MCEACPCFGIVFQVFAHKRESKSISLLVKKMAKAGCRIHGKRKLCRILEIRLSIIRKIHGGRGVQDQHTSQIRLCFILFDKEFIGLCEQLPIDMLGRFSRIIEPMLCKFDRKTMKRTFVQAGHKALNRLSRLKFYGIITP